MCGATLPTEAGVAGKLLGCKSKKKILKTQLLRALESRMLDGELSMATSMSSLVVAAND